MNTPQDNTDIIDKSVEDIFQRSKNVNNSSDSIQWDKHGWYKLQHKVSQFIYGPSMPKELKLLEQVQILLNNAPTDKSESLMRKCHYFIKMHRIVENTKARRRLETWAKRVIVVYLLIVLCIILSNKILNITDAVMITILSTTTVNIIGLGLIVLRGHFMSNDHENTIKEQKRRWN